MTWVQPVLLWGLLGLSIPVFIHFWNGSRGKVVNWAAFQWLKNQQSKTSRSLKLKNWLLLLIRMLFLITLVFLLAGMIWEGQNYKRDLNVVHLLWPDKQIEAEFRFELDQASKKGQQVRYLGLGLPVYQSDQEPTIDFSPNRLQDYFDELSNNFDSIYIYTSLMESFFPEIRYWLPQPPVIRVAENYSQKPINHVISLESGGFLEVDINGVLVKTAIQNYAGKPVSGEYSYAFEHLSEDKKASLRKALESISEIYGLVFREDNLNQASLLFSDSLATPPADNQFVFLLDSQDHRYSDQVVRLGNSRHQGWEELVEKGLLPELVLYHMVTYMGLKKADQKISKSQLEHKFSFIPKSMLIKTANRNELLLFFLLILFTTERFLAHRINL